MTDLWSPFRRFFAPEPDDGRADEKYAISQSEVVEFANTSYYPKFCAWLDREAAKPLPIGSHPDLMLQSAMRANTIREVRAHLDRIVMMARAAVESGKE